MATAVALETPVTAVRSAAPVPLRPGLSRWQWVILLGYSASLFLLSLGQARTFTAHEGLAVEVVQDMLAANDWLVPRIHGFPFLEKCPLHYWLMALSAQLFGGISEFTMRLPSVLFGLLGVSLIAALAGRWYGATVGLLTGLIQASTLSTIIYARLAECDVYLWAVVLACLAIFARNVVTPLPPRWYCGRLAFFALLGLTQLIKGPLFGVLLVGVPCLAYLALERQWRELGWFLYWPGWLLFGLLASAWPLAVMYYHPEALDIWWLHTLGRLDSRTAIGLKPWWYYCTTLPWQVLPWTLLMGLGLGLSAPRAWRDRIASERFLWVWCFSLFLVLSAIRGKHHHYLIYALPPCSFWAAAGLQWLASRSLPLRGRYWGGVLSLAAVALVVFLVLTAAGPLASVWWDVLVLGTLVLVATAGLCWAYQQRRIRTAGVLLFAQVWLAFTYTHLVLFPRADDYRADTELLQRLNQRAAASTPILMFDYFPQRELAYLRGPVHLCFTAADLRVRYQQWPDALILTTKASEQKLRALGGITLIDQTPGPRRRVHGLNSHLVVYQLRWSEQNPLSMK